jgi:hypothetical protein
VSADTVVAPECAERCQYAQDVGMPMYSCAAKCMYFGYFDDEATEEAK